MLRHREAVDASIQKEEQKGEALWQELRRPDPAFYERLARVKAQQQTVKA